MLLKIPNSEANLQVVTEQVEQLTTVYSAMPAEDAPDLKFLRISSN